ncbi:uncharacterized protein F4812DRAFT_439279 [Daldinia caldariorum]|uniref:uncharacterized protein n=1 Tax=Daldinia caldariorum TaxID=326644 RepID=UPI0020088A92|nr:uncharacterized protein F4812DRAFT_439279 [Daldinia caldariorum]KAI1465549.1 hypothetical protein F4812DRAFT_439279 [Daldinia caldariorum]
MMQWVCSHGAGAINTLDNSFSITANEGGSIIRPTKAGELYGTVLFPLHGMPNNVSYYNKVAVDFSSQTALVDEIVIMSGSDEVFQKKRLRKTGDFTIPLENHHVKAEEDGKGLALWIKVEFDTVTAELEFRSVGIEVVLAAPTSSPAEKIKLDSGTWNTGSVRPWDQPRERTEALVRFTRDFSSAPTVLVSMNTASVKKTSNFRVKVYATDITSQGFIIHADSWADTILYSCGATWLAIGS